MNSKEVTIHSTVDVVPINRGLPSEHEMMVFQTIAKQAFESKLYKGEQAAIMMTILAARELGIPPMLALNGGINNIQGKMEISARLMNALMRRAGISIRIKQSTEESCTLVGKRNDSQDIAEVSYTIAEAQKAGLIKPGGGWVKNPKDMLFARAISRLARQIAPDIIGGCYIEGEIRGSDAEVVLPNDIPMEIQENIEEDGKNLQRIKDLFDVKDSQFVDEYIEAVMKHFGWTQSKTLKEFLKDEKLIIEKFTVWKSRKA